ncbi:MAG: FAD-dependent oxidoreductase [Candidatus Omnitrophica bacterium]|nr:FAD-dependent oxidoreductase [Candidatus Omnitrophota bacterium]
MNTVNDKFPFNDPVIVVIIGGGFAGLSVVKGLCKKSADLKIILIDIKLTFDFLPALPDVVSQNISSQFLQADLTELSRRWNFEFICEEVKAVSLVDKCVSISNRTIVFDFLVVASGSQTNFYGHDNLKQNCLVFDTIHDALVLSEKCADPQWKNIIIAGGGYTGVELSSQVCAFIQRKRLNKKVLLLIRSDNPFQFLKQNQNKYTYNVLSKSGVDIRLKTEVKNIHDGRVELNTGEVIENALTVWTAGVKTPEFIWNMGVPITEQGRIMVNKQLLFADYCFAAGDSSAFEHQGNFLRMAVHFSCMEGLLIAQNILRIIKGLPLKEYKPFDLGYVLPLANSQACGIILGISVWGRIPLFLHYFMCIVKTLGWRKKWGIFKELIIHLRTYEKTFS